MMRIVKARYSRTRPSLSELHIRRKSSIKKDNCKMSLVLIWGEKEGGNKDFKL